MDTSTSSTSRATCLVLEALFWWGILLGAIACLILVNYRAIGDLLIGAICLVLALGHVFISHQALASANMSLFLDWGKILTALAAGVVCFTLPWPLGSRLVLTALLGWLAVGLHRQHHLAVIIWQVIVAVGLSWSLLLGYGLLSSAPWYYSVLAVAYLGLCLLITWWYRWRRHGRRVVTDPAVSDIEDLRQRGKLHELLDLPPDYNRLELTESYARKVRLYDSNNRAKEILKEAYDILMVNEDRELYRKSREVMAKVKKRCGEKTFNRVETRIWQELWAELNLKYPLQPEKITRAVHDDLVNKYSELLKRYG